MKKVTLYLSVCLWFMVSCRENKNSEQSEPKIQTPIVDSMQAIVAPKSRLSKEDSLALVLANKNKETFLQAQTFFKQKQYDKSIALLRKLLKGKFLTPESVLRIAENFLEVGHPFCLELCDWLIKNNPDKKDPEPFFIKALYYEQKKEYETAILYLDKSILCRWTFVEGFLKKGMIYFNQGKIDKAYQTFQQARTVQIRNADVYYWLAKCEERLGKKEQAMMNYRRAIFFDKNFSEARERLEELEKK